MKRPPCALMSVSAVTTEDCAALEKLAKAGFEVVVVQDENFEAALETIEQVRRKHPLPPAHRITAYIQRQEDWSRLGPPRLRYSMVIWGGPCNGWVMHGYGSVLVATQRAALEFGVDEVWYDSKWLMWRRKGL